MIELPNGDIDRTSDATWGSNFFLFRPYGVFVVVVLLLFGSGLVEVVFGAILKIFWWIFKCVFCAQCWFCVVFSDLRRRKKLKRKTSIASSEIGMKRDKEEQQKVSDIAAASESNSDPMVTQRRRKTAT